MTKEPNWIERLGRKTAWRHPAMYRWFGRLRNRGDCFATDFDVWIDGFPRSANTFALKAFETANADARVRSHRHIPTFVIKALLLNKPGMLLLRRPEDAVISWAIFWNSRIEPCLEYYLDFHQALRPYAPYLFVAPFELVTRDFGRVVDQFNDRFGTRYASPEHDMDLESGCFSLIEKTSFTKRDGSVDELRVCRPSATRSELKPALMARLCRAPALARKLARANDLYFQFAPFAAKGRQPERKPGSTQPLALPS